MTKTEVDVMVMKARIARMRRNDLAYSVPEVAGKLGVSENSVYEAIRRKEMPAVRIGRRVLVPKAALGKWLEGAP